MTKIDSLGVAILCFVATIVLQAQTITIHYTDGTQIGCNLTPTPLQPVDVPAVMVRDGYSLWYLCSVGEKPISAIYNYCLMERPTCLERNRILQHDEQTPPLYWCHLPDTK